METMGPNLDAGLTITAGVRHKYDLSTSSRPSGSRGCLDPRKSPCHLFYARFLKRVAFFDHLCTACGGPVGPQEQLNLFEKCATEVSAIGVRDALNQTCDPNHRDRVFCCV
jgi:hypothetical protein